MTTDTCCGAPRREFIPAPQYARPSGPMDGIAAIISRVALVLTDAQVPRLPRCLPRSGDGDRGFDFLSRRDSHGVHRNFHRAAGLLDGKGASTSIAALPKNCPPRLRNEPTEPDSTQSCFPQHT
jgi:hypothetical protein